MVAIQRKESERTHSDVFTRFSGFPCVKNADADNGTHHHVARRPEVSQQDRLAAILFVVVQPPVERHCVWLATARRGPPDLSRRVDQIAHQDQLTKLPNRHDMEQRLEKKYQQ